MCVTIISSFSGRVGCAYKTRGVSAVLPPTKAPPPSHSPPRFPCESTTIWVLPHPNLVSYYTGHRAKSPTFRVSLKSSSTRSSTTSQTTPPLFDVALSLQGLLFNHAAATSSDELCSVLITFPPGRLLSLIPRCALPHTPTKCASILPPRHRYSSRSTCRTFQMSVI